MSPTSKSSDSTDSSCVSLAAADELFSCAASENSACHQMGGATEDDGSCDEIVGAAAAEDDGS
jgi:hypothetical protein